MSFEAELVRKYGPDVLAVSRNQVPPRVATPLRKGNTVTKRMLAVVPRAGARRKLVDEIRQGGHKAHVCRHRETKEVPVNLVFTNALPAFAKHAANVLGEIATREILNLYGKRPVTAQKAADRFEVGQTLKLVVGPWAKHEATITDDDGKKLEITITLFGRPCPIRIKPGDLRRYIDPG